MRSKPLEIGDSVLEFDIPRGILTINNTGYKRDVISIKDKPVASFQEGGTDGSPTKYTFTVPGRPNINVFDKRESNEDSEKILGIINWHLGAMYKLTY